MNYLKFAIHTGFGVALVVATTAAVEAQTFYQSPGVVQGGFVQQGGFVPQGGIVQQGAVVQQAQQPLQQPTEEQLKQLRIGANLYDNGANPVVRSVFTNGPAQKAGLQSGDAIIKINGEAATNVADFNSKLASMAAGDTFQLTRSRGGEESDITVSVMTLADVLQASLVPEPGMFDSTIAQSKSRIVSVKQQIENAKMDMQDLEKRLAGEEKELAELMESYELNARIDLPSTRLVLRAFFVASMPPDRNRELESPIRNLTSFFDVCDQCQPFSIVASGDDGGFVFASDL